MEMFKISSIQNSSRSKRSRQEGVEPVVQQPGVVTQPVNVDILHPFAPSERNGMSMNIVCNKEHEIAKQLTSGSRALHSVSSVLSL